MKKKFLSLMMAAAVVATTSVSAFAAEVKTDGGEVDVTITGSVNGPNDAPPEGTISVSVPTALTFTVKENGTFTGSSLTITNNGTEAVDVFAYEFTDISNSTNGIEVKKELGGSDNRTKVTLNLRGNRGIANFASEVSTGKGVYDAKLAPATNDGVIHFTLCL